MHLPTQWGNHVRSEVENPGKDPSSVPAKRGHALQSVLDTALSKQPHGRQSQKKQSQKKKKKTQGQEQVQQQPSSALPERHDPKRRRNAGGRCTASADGAKRTGSGDDGVEDSLFGADAHTLQHGEGDGDQKQGVLHVVFSNHGHVSATHAAPAQAQESHGQGSESRVFSVIRESILRSTNMPNVSEDIELDTILSRVPYYKMLEDLFGGEDAPCDDVPVVSAVYEEQFMRECMHDHERPCVMGSNCECMFIDPNMPFVGVEFLLPSDVSSGDQPQMCVLCSRKTTQQLFYDMVYKGFTFRGVIQRYGNICDQPGEYARECMLICPPSHNVQCMPLPIVSHQRNRYSVKVCSGVRHIKQHRVYAKDF